MTFGNFKVPTPINEPVKSYAPNSPEKKELKAMLAQMKSEVVDIPMYIGSERIYTEQKVRITPPYEHQHTLGYFNMGDSLHVEQAVRAAMGAKHAWANLS